MLADILHKIAEDEQDLTRPFHPRPSLAGPERCERALTYYAKGEPRAPWPGRFMQVLDDSTWHAELIKDQIRKSAYKLHSEEMEIQTAVGPGHIDGIITDLLGADYLLEIKAVNHFTFQRYLKGDLPKDYLTQTGLYIDGVRKVNPAITRGLLFIKNKNNAAYMEVLVEYDVNSDFLKILEMTSSEHGDMGTTGMIVTDITKRAAEKMERIESNVETGHLPDRPYPYGTDFPCSYCQWAKTCWRGYEESNGYEEPYTELSVAYEGRAELYHELSAQITDLTKEKDGLKDEIKLALMKDGVSGGRAGKYYITIRFQERKVLKADIPESARSKFFETKKSEILRVRKRGDINAGE